MTSGPHNHAARLWTAVAVLPALVLVCFQAAWPLPFFSDDSFISLRYSARLLEGHGLTWTTDSAGQLEYVEGYSNLLWVVLTAALGALGIELVMAARILGGICTVLGLWWLASAMRPSNGKNAICAAVAPLLVASTQPVMIWTLAGLEGPLVFALLALGFAGLIRHFADEHRDPVFRRTTLLWCGLPFAAVCLTRPDGPLWALMAGAGLFAMSWSQGLATAVQRALFFGLPSLLLVAAQMAFRVSYYGDYVPNTAHVKAEFDPASFGPGFAFVKGALLVMPGLAIAAALGIVVLALQRRTRAFTLVLLLPVLAWLTYLMVIGGDHFPGLRLMHGVIVPLALLGSLVLRATGNLAGRIVMALAIGLACSYWNFDTARQDPRSHEARAESWEWEHKAVGEVLGRAFSEQQPRIAVDSAGSLPFYSQLPTLDMLGLCDRTIAKTPFPDWLQTVKPGTPKPPGHLRGNGGYVMQQRPDLILFKSVLPVFVSGCEFEADPRFIDNYRLVRLDLNRPDLLPAGHRMPLWLRLDGKVGVQRTEQRVMIPAYLFGGFQMPGAVINRWQPPTGDQEVDGKIARNGALALQFWGQASPAVTPDETGQLQLRLSANQQARLALSLAAGTYRVDVEPAACAATLAVTDGGTLLDGRLTIAESAVTTLELTANQEGKASVVRIVLHRTP